MEVSMGSGLAEVYLAQLAQVKGKAIEFAAKLLTEDAFILRPLAR
jgi:hypothetical protein